MYLRYFKSFSFCAAMFLLTGDAQATTVNWVGGNGTWYLGTGIWSPDYSALNCTGSCGGGDIQAVIDGPGSIVYYNADLTGGFRWRPGTSTGVTVSGGATFNMESDVFEDGAWMLFDGNHFTVTGEGSLFNRYNTPNVSAGTALNGGAMIFGTWRGYTNPLGYDIGLNALDGGEICNKGQTWFGAYGDEELLNATLTIGTKAKFSNYGALENGISLDDSAGVGNEGEFNFIYSTTNTTTPNAHHYQWNFTGNGGEIDLGEQGIRLQVSNGIAWTSTQVTYNNLWDGVASGLSSDDEILAFEGIHSSDTSGLFQFEDFWKVTGVSGSDGYKLEAVGGALPGGSHVGDLNGDSQTDASDFGILAGNFGSVGTPTTTDGDINWTAADANGGDDLVDAADIGVMFGTWTGDHGPAGAGEVTAHYDPATGEIEVDVNGVVNWYVEDVGSAAMTGDAPVGLPQAPGLVTDNDTRIGESAFAPFSYSQNLGNVAATGLANDGSLQVFWNASLGGELQSAAITFVPEPTTLALAGFALCGALATRRRAA